MQLSRRAAKRRSRARKAKRLLRALTGSALALPGLAPPAGAESPPSEVRADYHYSRYSEDSLPSRKVAAGDRSRYDIDVHQFRIEAGLSDRIGVNLNLAHEVMSGATPWYITPDTNGDPVQVMTEATIDEQRTDALLSGDLYFDRGKASLGGGVSIENDYLAFNGSLAGERQYNDKNTTLSGGIGASYDRITPTDTNEFPTRPDEEDKQSYELFLALGQVLGHNTLGQTSLKYQHSRGFLSDPYKLAVVAGNPETDERPDDRNQIAWLTRYRHHFKRLRASMHLDYTFSADDWEIYAHTFELSWHQTIFDKLMIVPGARYYSQSQADFYEPFYIVQRSDGLRSSDYRLSPYGAYSFKVRAEYPFELFTAKLALSAGYERYVSDADVALESVDVENPGLVSYNLYTVGISGRF